MLGRKEVVVAKFISKSNLGGEFIKPRLDAH
ncbi:unannotated protein [freshwater metagenome]|uniref:Unannotated protein n=1 Tax=freshwater metagenome TaxID=449393 RepID=A0A6J6WQI3_9ZZZZ